MPPHVVSVGPSPVRASPSPVMDGHGLFHGGLFYQEGVSGAVVPAAGAMPLSFRLNSSVILRALLGRGRTIPTLNERIYDPRLGRFMQADPIIQFSNHSQSRNRYSYVLNNPLNATDPSGYIFKKLFKGLNKLFGDFAPFLSIALLAIPVVRTWVIQSWVNAFQFGFVTGGIATGSFKGALFGGISAAAFYQIGSQFVAESGFFQAGGVGHVLTHGLAGGILAELQGGQFGHGFLAAGLSKAVMGRFKYDDLSTPAVLGRTAIAATVGGTISRITGGKFANGALTSAMAQLFNNEATARGQLNEQKEKIFSTTDKQGNTIYTRGDSKVIVVKGVVVKNTEDGNTISDILTVSENLDKTVYVISGYRPDNATSEHYRVAADIYVDGVTAATAPTFRDQIHKLNIFNRVASYHNKNTIHVDYKSTGNQGRFHDSGKGWDHIK